MIGIMDKERRVGEVRKMNCGLLAKIINYNSSRDVTIEFEDGVVKEGVRYYCFVKGLVRYPRNKAKYVARLSKCRKDRIGEVRRMKCGLEAEIVKYNSNKNISVRFSNGELREDIPYSSFRAGLVRPPSIGKNGRLTSVVGDVQRMNCGLNAEIIEYNGCNDITVRFSNGVVKGGISYQAFKKGSVSTRGGMIHKYVLS